MTVVMIVDDEESQRLLMTLTLGDGRFDLVEAADGESAVRLAEAHRPALMFLDWQMPGLSGIEVCRRLRETLGKRLTIVMLSGRDQRQDRDEALAAGADDYLVKPFSPLELMDKVTEILGPEALA